MLSVNIFDFDETLYGTKSLVMEAYDVAYKRMFDRALPMDVLEYIWDCGLNKASRTVFSKQYEIGGDDVVRDYARRLREEKNKIYADLVKSNPPVLYKRVSIISSAVDVNYVCTKSSEESYRIVTEQVQLPFEPNAVFFSNSRDGSKTKGAFEDLRIKNIDSRKGFYITIFDDSEEELFASLIYMKKILNITCRFFLVLVKSGFPNTICQGMMVCD